MKPKLTWIPITLLALVGTLHAQEQDSVDDLDGADAQNCVPLVSVDRTDVVDDRNILFFMKDGRVLLNRLRNRCPELKVEESFMYRITMNRICHLDSITVLRNIGFGLGSGASCGLGKFYPISPDEAKAMLDDGS